MDMYQKRKERQENKKNETYDEKKTNINWYPGHMAKTKREISESLGLIDIVYELCDARIPYSSKNNEISELIKNKPKILIMTKIDLCDMKKTSKWKEYYEEKGYKVVLVDLINNKNLKEIFSVTDELLKPVNEKRNNQGLKSRKGRILVLGIPNVGKSTLINRLVGKKVVNVGNKPGVTKNLSWIRINDKIELLDTPGILWPRLDSNDVALNLASLSAIKEEILDIEEVSLYIINKMLKKYPLNIKERYSLKEDKDINVILDEIGNKIGAIKNNMVDYNRVYDRIIRDLKDGYLGKITFDEI